MPAPTAGDLLTWVSDVDGLNTTSATQAFQLDETVAAARTAVEGRCRAKYVDEADVGFVAYPPPIHTAVLILAARLYSRRSATEGVAGFGDLGVVRFSATDVDVEALLAPYLRIVVG